MTLWDIIHKIYVEILVTGLGLVNVIVHGEKLVEKFSKLLGIKKYIERRLGERRRTMLNPLKIVEDIDLAVNAIEKLKAALPSVQKLVYDIKQTSEDKGDPTKLYADLDIVLADVNSDLTLLAGIFPSSAPVVVNTPAVS